MIKFGEIKVFLQLSGRITPLICRNSCFCRGLGLLGLVGLKVAISSAVMAEEKDVLRFLNGDSLHGKFIKVDETHLWWQRGSNPAARFDLDEIRHLAFNNGRGHKFIEPQWSLELITGDRLPGDLVSMDTESLALSTEFAGDLTFRRDQVKSLQQIPNGQELIFFGPYHDQNWDVLCRKMQGDEADDPPVGFDSAAFYCRSIGFLTASDVTLPDDFELNFRLSLRDAGMMCVGFFSDRARVGDEGFREQVESGEIRYLRQTLYPEVVGNGLIFEIFSNIAKLYQLELTEVDQGEKPEDGLEDNDAGAEAPVKQGNLVNLGETARFSDSARELDSVITIRSSRGRGLTQMLVDGQLVGTWTEQQLGKAASANGTALHFLAMRGRSKISEVSVNHWNLMPDSALSMHSPDRDILLLNSGTDRFAGTIGKLEEGVIEVESHFGHLKIEPREIAYLSFAEDSLASYLDQDLPLIKLILPFGGEVRGQLTDKEGEIWFQPLLGKGWPLDTNLLKMVEFADYDSKLDRWNER